MPDPSILHVGQSQLQIAPTRKAWRLTDSTGLELGSLDALGNLHVQNIAGASKGTIPLRLLSARLKALGNIAANGGDLATDTNPSIGQRNGDTDPGMRVSWAASHSEAIVLEGEVPDDCDLTVAASLALTLSYAGATNTAAGTVAVFVGIGGSDLGGSTGALTTTPTDTAIALTLPAVGKQIVVVFTPGAHTTDILRLDNARITYTRK